MLDPSLRVLWVSRTFERYFELERGELLGHELHRLLESRLGRVVADPEAVAAALAQGGDEATHPFECCVRAEDRSRERWLEYWSQPIRSGRHAGGRIGYFYDVTGRKRAEEAARKSEDQLAQAQKMEAVGRLAGGLAHDFNNLLTAINGYTDLLLRLSDEERLQSYVGEIKKAGDRAADLTSKLLALSRPPPSSHRVVDLNQLVLNLEDLLQRLLGEDVELETQLEPDLDRVRIDPGQLEQVLLNLAVNARDAMPTGGRLLLATGNVDRGQDLPLDREPDHRRAGGAQAKRRTEGAQAKRCVCLEVSDTGVGIDADVREHIFEPFFTTKEEDKGTGLGLSTVYAAVAQNRGHIEVESAPGKGATFRILLPSEAGEIERDPARGQGAAPRRGNERILLVEDDAAVRKLVRELLEQQGYKVTAAEHAAQALELVASQDQEIEFLVTDVVMPGMSGPDLAARLVQRFPGMKILFISGYTDSLVLRHGLTDAQHVMLQKPFDARLLATRVRELLDQPRA